MSIIIFYRNKKRVIDDKIKDIAFSIKNWDLVKAEEIERKKRESMRKIIEKNRKNIIKNNKKDKKDIKMLKIINMNPIDFYFLEKIINKQNPIKKKVKINTRFNINNNYINNFIKTENKPDSNTNILDKKNKEQEIIQKLKQIMAFNDEEKNNLPYKLALKYDKRSFIEFYISLLKTNHNLIFSFFYDGDYNSRIIKIDLFLVDFCIFFTVNALFFNDDTMHKIYEDKGKFNFIYQLPQIIYSSLISFVLNIILKLLALSESNILSFKKNKTKVNLDERHKDLNKKLNRKFIFYFIISSIFLIIFWYYLSMFGAIYRHTQYHLIKDTAISFGLSLLYPFVIYLIPGIFRIPALSKPKNKREYLYNLSQIFQKL